MYNTGVFASLAKPRYLIGLATEDDNVMGSHVNVGEKTKCSKFIR